MESNLGGTLQHAKPRPRSQEAGQKPATNSIQAWDAPTHLVNTGIDVPSVAKMDTGVTIAQTSAGSEEGLQPKYLRYNLWGADQSLPITTAEWSETAIPLPRPPPAELENPDVNRTLASHPHLFAVNTPLHIDHFEHLLEGHPNRPFVDSVLAGLREGFWPWATTQKPNFPSQHREPPTGRYTTEHLDFFRGQLKHEQDAGRYSASAGTSLLPGMFCMPVYAVPKPQSDDLRLVNDYSAGPYALNAMVDHDRVTGYPLDNLHLLGQMLLDLHVTSASLELELVMWKDDIAEAYRMCPMHPVWQLKQAVCIDGEFYIDRACCFGSSASFAIFASVNSLVAWIAKNLRGITPLITYVDDSSGAAIAGDIAYYPPYDDFLPTPQASLLTLWDELGIPHKRHKQLHGDTLPIIGIVVDPNRLSFTLPDLARQRLSEELQKWSARKTLRFPLRRWQKLCGWINWVFNVFPLLRPCLNNVYPKMAGKTHRDQNICLNNSIRADFAWAARTLDHLNPVFILDSLHWGPEDADLTIFCDACPHGLGFWNPKDKTGFYAASPYENPPFIFFLEALCVLNALLFSSEHATQHSKVLLRTDSQNTVDIFSSLRCLPEYNGIIRSSVDFRLSSQIDLRVLHVPGEKNQVADALSRAEFTRALDLCPGLSISSFTPFIPSLGNDATHMKPPRFMVGGGTI
jgi:hypothetical protein